MKQLLSAIREHTLLWGNCIIFSIGTIVILLNSAIENPLNYLVASPFFLIATTTFILGIWTIWIAFRSPQNMHNIHWWVHFIGGIVGALTFALPSIAVFPITQCFSVEPLWLGALFTGLGLLTLLFVILYGRKLFIDRPHWEK